MGKRSVLDHVLPAALFGLLGCLSINHVVQSSNAAESSGLRFVYQLLSISYVAVLAVLFFIRRTPISQRASLTTVAIALGGTFSPWLMAIQPHTIDDWRVLAISDLLMLIGVGLTIYSLGTLGRCFGLAAEARGLVTSGPYRWVRNPAYVAEFVTVLGLSLPLLSPVAITIFALFTVLQLRRITLEERVLSATFPEYDDYRRRTPALVPRFATDRVAQVRVSG